MKTYLSGKSRKLKPGGQTIHYVLIPVLGARQEFGIDGWTDRQASNLLQSFIRPHFDEDYEHVAVLFEGHRRDMFVGGTSAINGRHIRNVRATEIYRANALSQNPRLDPESLPAISGPAVLFPDRIIWK